MKAIFHILLVAFLCFALTCQAANWNDPQGNLVDLPSEVTVSDLARPRDSLEEEAAYIVEQARIAMRRAAQARKLQNEAEQQRRIVEMAAMERAEAAQAVSGKLEAQRAQDGKIRELAENERYEAQFEGMSEQDRRVYEQAFLERKMAEKEEQDRRIYEQALQERQDQRIRELALKEQQAEQDQRIRELALKEQQEVQDQRIRELALKEQREEQDQRIRELALEEQQEVQDQRIRELALKEQQEVRDLRIRELQRQVSADKPRPFPHPETVTSVTSAAPTEVRTVSIEEDRVRQAIESIAAVSVSPPSVTSPVVEVADSTEMSEGDQPYLIGAGDVLFISVWKDDVLTRNVTVSPDGTINFPLVGTLQAAGKTVAVLKQELEQRIAPYVPDPVVSLELTQVNSMFVFILGRVNHPGRFALNSKVNVLQALATAGGLNPYAEKKKIKIIREQEDGTQVFPFNYKDVVKGRQLETNITLQRGDVILVP